MSKSMFISILAVVLVIILGFGMVAALSKGFQSWDLFKKAEETTEEVEEKAKEEEQKEEEKETENEEEETPVPSTNQAQQTPAPNQNTPSNPSQNQTAPTNPTSGNTGNTVYTGYPSEEEQEPEQTEDNTYEPLFILVSLSSVWNGETYIPSSITFDYISEQRNNDGFISMDVNSIAGMFYSKRFEPITATFLERNGTEYEEEEVTLFSFSVNNSKSRCRIGGVP